MSAPSSNATTPVASNVTAPVAPPMFSWTGDNPGYFELTPSAVEGQLAALILLCVAVASHLLVGFMYYMKRYDPCSSHSKSKKDMTEHTPRYPGTTLATFGLVTAFIYGTHPGAQYYNPLTSVNVPWGFALVSGLFISLYAYDFPAWIVGFADTHKNKKNKLPLPADNVGRAVVACFAATLQLLFVPFSAAMILLTITWVIAMFCLMSSLVFTMRFSHTMRDGRFGAQAFRGVFVVAGIAVFNVITTVWAYRAALTPDIQSYVISYLTVAIAVEVATVIVRIVYIMRWSDEPATSKSG